MAVQLSFAEVKPRAPRSRWAVLPDAARVEERLNALARAHGFVPGRVALSIAELDVGVAIASEVEQGSTAKSLWLTSWEH